jgi:hypothetical protein
MNKAKIDALIARLRHQKADGRLPSRDEDEAADALELLSAGNLSSDDAALIERLQLLASGDGVLIKSAFALTTIGRAIQRLAASPAAPIRAHDFEFEGWFDWKYPQDATGSRPSYQSTSVMELMRAAFDGARDLSPAAPAQSAEPVAWAVYWGIGDVHPNSVHFEKETAAQVASQIKSNTELRPLYAAAQPAQTAQSAEPKKEKARRLIGYGECRCILSQYCDGTCRPIFESAAAPQPVEQTAVVLDERAALTKAFELLNDAVACMEDRKIDDCDFAREARALLATRAASPQPVEQTRALTGNQREAILHHCRMYLDDESGKYNAKSVLTRIFSIAAQPASGDADQAKEE